MATHVSHAALPYPIKGARFSMMVPFLDSTGTPTDPVTPDTEASLDGAAFADTTEEITVITGANGSGLFTLTGDETNTSATALAFKSASGPKVPLGSVYPRVLAQVTNSTFSAGSAGGATLNQALGYDVSGCFIVTTGGLGGGGGSGSLNNQARRIITHNTTTGAITVAPNWEVTPDNTTQYKILLPEGMTLGSLRALNPATLGQTIAVDASGRLDVSKISGTAQTAGDIKATLGTPASSIVNDLVTLSNLMLAQFSAADASETTKFGISTGNINSKFTAAPAANADALLARSRAGGANTAPTVADALAGGLMDIVISGTTLTVRNGLGATVYTRTISRSAVDAIISSV
jgi:hypothetical protein